MVRQYVVSYINSDGKTVTATTPFFVCAQSIAKQASAQHGNAHIGCANDPTFRTRWYEHGEQIS